MSRLLAPLLILSLAAPASADWDVKRAPDDPRVGEALLGALLTAPDDRGALHRLTSHVGKKSLGKFAERCEARATGLARLACGHLRREAGDNDAAKARFLEASAAAPDDPRPHRAAGELARSLGHADEALAELEAARSRTKPADRATILEALLPVYATAKQPDVKTRQQAAIAAGHELVSLRPSDGALRRRVADALSAVGVPEQALAILSTLVKTTHDPQVKLPLLFRIAELADDAHKDDEASAALEQAMSLLPAHDDRRREALERIASVERRRERLPQLIERWSALPEARRDAAVEDVLGRLLDELGERDAAQKHLLRAIKLDPRALPPRRLLIRVYTRAGDETAAIAELRKLVTMSGGDARLMLELAERLYARPGGIKEALALAASIGSRHRDPTTHAALAALYDKWGERDRALAEQQLLTKLEPADPEHLIALGELYDQRGDKAMAKKTWQRLAPGNAPPKAAVLRLADVLAEHDAPGEALALLERVAHDHPGDAAVDRRLADVLDRLHRDSEAVTLYKRLLDAAVKADDAGAVRELGARWLELATRREGLAPALRDLAKAAEHPKAQAQVELALLLARGRVREKRGLEAERILRDLARDATRPADRARALESLADLLGQRSGNGAVESLELMLQAAIQDPTRAPLLYGKASERASSLYRDEEALRYAEKALQLAPLDADAHERIGVLLEARDPARALAEFDRALELDASRDRLRLRAAELALRRGDDDSAAARYRALLAHARDEQAIEEAARRAVVVHELTGRLGELEREVAPRAGSGAATAGALRRLLIEIDRRYVPLLAARAEAGDTAARAELKRISTHALAPLLDGVIDGDREERRAAIQLLGQLGAHGSVPLLLRLAAGEAARRGAEPPPTELRTAAAEVVAWLVTAEDLPWLQRIAADPEQRIRLAAAVGLGRIASDARARDKLAVMINDDHERVSAAACLGLLNVEASPTTTVPRIWERSLDTTRPLAMRACSLVFARYIEHDPTAKLIAPRWRERASAVAATPGMLRAYVASGDATTIELALSTALKEPWLHNALVARRSDAATAAIDPPRAGGVVDLGAWLALREAVRPARHPGAILDAATAMLDHAASAPAGANLLEIAILDDLAEPDGLLARLCVPDTSGATTSPAPDGLAAARGALVDRMMTLLARIAQTHSSARSELTVRRLALLLLATRPAGIATLVATAHDGDAATRRAVWLALADPRAATLAEADGAPLLPALKGALAATDWRERRAALTCLRRHPALAAHFESERAALRADPSPFVAEVADPANTTVGQPISD